MADDVVKPAKKGKSPLDVLEEILDDADEKKAKKEADQKSAEEEAQRIAREQESRLRDQAALEQQRALMTDIEASPEEMAREKQIATKQEEHQKKAQDQEGYEIRQVTHTKV